MVSSLKTLRLEGFEKDEAISLAGESSMKEDEEGEEEKDLCAKLSWPREILGFA